MEENTVITAAPATEAAAPVAPAKKPFKRVNKKKVCQFCVEKATSIDYKEVGKLRKYVTEKGKMLPRRMTGVCAKHQRMLAEAVKRATIVALLPFKGE
jgi:small subunit ribosomal protein S18